MTLIDFPQMISTSHTNADYYFNRDVECVRTFFRRRFGFVAAQVPTLDKDTARNEHALDEQLAASGWTPAQETEFAALAGALAEETAAEGEAEGEGEREAEGEGEGVSDVESEAGEEGGSEGEGEGGASSSSSDGEEEPGEGDVETAGLRMGQPGVRTGPDVVEGGSGGAAFGAADVEGVVVRVEHGLGAGATAGVCGQAAGACGQALAADVRTAGSSRGASGSKPGEMHDKGVQGDEGASSCSHGGQGRRREAWRGASGSAAEGIHGGRIPGDEQGAAADAVSGSKGRGSEADEPTHSQYATSEDEEATGARQQYGRNRSQPVHAGQSRISGQVARREQTGGGGSGRGTESGSNARVAERVKQELRRKDSLRQAKGGSRNEAKNRDQRKLEASVRREVNGSGGW